MKTKVPFDQELGTNARRSYWSIRSIGSLMIVVAVIGLLLCRVPMRLKRLMSGSPTNPPIPATILLAQGPGKGLRATVDETRDRFVVMASLEIDPEMVLPAPDIDEAMVVRPGGSMRIAPRVGGAPIAPGQKPVPVPDRRGPHEKYSPRVIPKPKPR